VTSLRDPLLLACGPYSPAQCVISRGGIYQLILSLRRGERGEPSFARLRALPSYIRRDPALNAAANRIIGPSAAMSKLPNASHCGGLATREAKAS